MGGDELVPDCCPVLGWNSGDDEVGMLGVVGLGMGGEQLLVEMFLLLMAGKTLGADGAKKLVVLLALHLLFITQSLNTITTA